MAEVVGAVGIGQDLVHVALDAGALVEAGRQEACEARSQVNNRGLLFKDLLDDPGDLERQGERAADEAAVVGPQEHREVDVGDRRAQFRVEDPHHLLGGDAVCGQACDERAGAGPHVDVELVDGVIYRQEVQGPERADLVNAAGEAAAAEDQRGLRDVALAPLGLLAPWLGIARRVELDDLAHRLKYRREGGTHVRIHAQLSSIRAYFAGASRDSRGGCDVCDRRRGGVRRGPGGRDGHTCCPRRHTAGGQEGHLA